MIKYYISTYHDPDKGHEIHKEDCRYMPDIKNRMYLGSFYNCQQAVRLAKLTFPNSEGCKFCMSGCNN